MTLLEHIECLHIDAIRASHVPAGAQHMTLYRLAEAGLIDVHGHWGGIRRYAVANIVIR